ncbi:hypothetical protein D6833_13230 [Candidatus Parcubacteria bacterium]|nr:MAG: hypothetical protein D6833_13230 [Candidatus Parcubacteria bacterium]
MAPKIRIRIATGWGYRETSRVMVLQFRANKPAYPRQIWAKAKLNSQRCDRATVGLNVGQVEFYQGERIGLMAMDEQSVIMQPEIDTFLF